MLTRSRVGQPGTNLSPSMIVKKNVPVLSRERGYHTPNFHRSGGGLFARADLESPVIVFSYRIVPKDGDVGQALITGTVYIRDAESAKRHVQTVTAPYRAGSCCANGTGRLLSACDKAGWVRHSAVAADTG